MHVCQLRKPAGCVAPCLKQVSTQEAQSQARTTEITCTYVQIVLPMVSPSWWYSPEWRHLLLAKHLGKLFNHRIVLAVYCMGKLPWLHQVTNCSSQLQDKIWEWPGNQPSHHWFAMFDRYQKLALGKTWEWGTILSGKEDTPLINVINSIIQVLIKRLSYQQV